MQHGRLPLALVLLVVATALAGRLEAGAPRRAPAGPLVTIHAPNTQRLELALDEVELHYPSSTAAGGSAPAASAVEVAGTRLDFAEGGRAIFALSSVTDLSSLHQAVTTLAAANPTAQPALVAYEPGLPKSNATLRLITHEVGLVLDPGQDVGAVVAGLTIAAVRHVPGVSSGYVVVTSDPFDALQLADVLRQRPGVASAYPIVRRLIFGR